MRYPAPHSDRPLTSATVTAATVLRACDKISRGMSKTNAFRTEGVRWDRPSVVRGAEKDPFYDWMLECVEYAEAHFVGGVEVSLGEIANKRDEEGRFHKDAIRAQTTILSKRSEEYAERAQEVRTTNTVSITIDKMQLLLAGGVAPSSVVGAAFPALPDDSIIDAINGEGEAGENEVRMTVTPKAFALRRKGAQ
jgi:hypothetical protein